MAANPAMKTKLRVGGGDVHLRVTIGDRQIGGSAVRLDGQLIASGAIDRQHIGRGPDLVGKELFVKTVVSDVNDDSNHTSVTYTLIQGDRVRDFMLNADVDKDGDHITYRAIFDLIGGA